MTRLYSDDHDNARFEDVEVSFIPEDPLPDATSISAPLAASALLFARGAAGGGHAEQPEHQRQLAIFLSGTCEVTAPGETRTFRTGDVLLIEDTEGSGHSSRTLDGFIGAVIVLEPSHLQAGSSAGGA